MPTEGLTELRDPYPRATRLSGLWRIQPMREGKRVSRCSLASIYPWGELLFSRRYTEGTDLYKAPCAEPD